MASSARGMGCNGAPPQETDRECVVVAVSALNSQEGGSHYKDLAIQPVEYIHRNALGFVEGCVVKYVSRWRSKGGVDDLRKARHFLDILIELEDPSERPAP